MGTGKLKARAVVAAGLLLAGLPAGAAPKLKLGSPAPALEVSRWVKGKPVPRLEKGKAYVIEFWATWCGPCKATIPHLTRLQKRYPQLTVIGVSILEEEPSAVAPYVREMGSRMDYRVALDMVPAGQSPDRGRMALNWMDAAGLQGIPTAFVVDASGRIAWTGHPMEMEEPLAKIMAGKWDVARAAAERAERQTRQAQLQAVVGRLKQVGSDPARALKILNEAIRATPGIESNLGTMKFHLMRLQGDSAGAAVYGRRLVDKVVSKDAEALDKLAWAIVAPESQMKPDAGLLALALQAAERANTLSGGKNAGILDTLAKVFFDRGDARRAVQLQTQAVAGAGASAEMKQRLAQYRKAAGQ